MDVQERSRSVAQLTARNRLLTISNFMLAAIAVIAVAGLFLKDEKVILQTPGLPHRSVIEKTSLDKASQAATLKALTSTLATINPANYQYQMKFAESFFSAEDFTRLNQETRETVEKMIKDKEFGSRYFVFTDYQYDPAINKHFVLGDVHFVNAAKDTAVPTVYEYELTVENYRPLVTFIDRYEGDRPHNKAWLDNQLQNQRTN